MNYNEATTAYLQRCIQEDRARLSEVECLRVQVADMKRKIRQQNDMLFALRRVLADLGVDWAEVAEVVGREVKEDSC